MYKQLALLCMNPHKFRRMKNRPKFRRMKNRPKFRRMKNRLKFRRMKNRPKFRRGKDKPKFRRGKDRPKFRRRKDRLELRRRKDRLELRRRQRVCLFAERAKSHGLTVPIQIKNVIGLSALTVMSAKLLCVSPFAQTIERLGQRDMPENRNAIGLAAKDVPNVLVDRANRVPFYLHLIPV